MACRWQPGMKITALLDALNSALAEPFALAWSQDSPRFLLVFTVVYAVAVIMAVTDQKNTRPGAEHGSAAWGDVFRLNKFYMDKRGPNLLLTQHFYIGIDGYKHKHNTNILIVGGSGAGKTRTYGVPNVLECACSMVITDPKSEILRKTGNLLKQKGYEVIVFDLINPATSFCYNPFVYVHDDREVLTLIENLIQNTTPPHAQSSDPFWTKSETALLQALMACYYHYCALLRKAYHGKATKRCYFLLREDFLLFSRYQQQTKFLWENHIETMDELLAYKESAEVQIQQLARQRKVLYRQKREPERAAREEKIKSLTQQMKALRHEVYICSDIETDAAEVQEKLRQAELAAQEERNEVKQDEQRRRSSRSDGAGSLTGYRGGY